MPNADILNVSDSLLKFANKTRFFSDTTPISEQLLKVTAKAAIKSLSDTLSISENLDILGLTKQRLISETTIISETIQLYKNGILVEPVAEIPTPQNILGTRERRVRALRRPPRPIIIDEVVNVAIAPLKLLAFSDSINKAIVGIRPRSALNVVRSEIRIGFEPTMIVQSSIKTSLQPMIVKAVLGLPLSSLHLTTAKLKLRPQVQYIQSLKAINGERVDKLHKLVTIAMMIENL